MAYAGQMVENPVTGERIVFRQTSADTGGELVAIDLALPVGGHVPGVHVHRPPQHAQPRFHLC